LQNAGVTRREVYRQRLLRDRPSIARQLFIDRDETPTGVARTANDREDTLFDLSFATLPPEFNLETNNSNLPAIPAGAESEEEETESVGSDTSTDASTITTDLDRPTDGIPLGLLRAWERNGEIRRSPEALNRQVQTSPSPSLPRTPNSFPGYLPPSYSPVSLGGVDLDSPNISPSDDYVDYEVNQLLDYLNSEEFLDSIVES